MADNNVDSLLKIANTPVLSKFLHDCVSDLTSAKHLNFDNYNSDIEWTIEDFTNAKKRVQNFYRQCIINDSFDLKSTNFGSNVEDELRNCFEIRKDEIFEGLVKETLLNNGAKLVENIDWRIKWVIGSSQMATIREPLLQVDLHCSKKRDSGVEKERVNFEVNLEKLDNLIERLEKACDEMKNE